MTLNVVETLRSELLRILRPALSGRDVALIDFPRHSNCGDSAIWQGEIEALRRMGARIVYSCDTSNYRPAHIRSLRTKPLLLLHGGGNLGDLWVRHQKLREAVVSEFADHEIIQLPQSVHFKEEAALRRTQEVFDAHPHLTLLLRDTQSLDFCRQNFRAPSKLCPDAAFMLDLGRRAQPVVDVLVLARTDGEQQTSLVNGAVDASVQVVDWLLESAEVPRYIEWSEKVLHRTVSLPSSLRPVPAEFVSGLLQNRIASFNVARACEILGRGRAVITDRLHAHILCELMGIPNVAVDTGYGKIKGVHEAWMAESSVSRMATSFDEALHMLRADGLVSS